MKALKTISILAVSAMLCSYTHKKAHQRIVPLPACVDVASMEDCTIPVSFKPNDFNWMGGNLHLTVYNEDLYDALEISKMRVKDTLIYDSKPIVVKKIAKKNGEITINDGLEEGGCWIISNGGGTFVPKEWDDHSVYTKLGEAVVPLADSFIIVDCGENLEDPNDTIRTNQKQYIEGLTGSRCDFYQLNTKVTIKKGKITEIHRKWIP